MMKPNLVIAMVLIAVVVFILLTSVFLVYLFKLGSIRYWRPAPLPPEHVELPGSDLWSITPDGLNPQYAR